MKLQVFRQMSYISPSSFLKWKSCQYKIYLQRLAGLPYVPDVQGVPAAIGSVFDALVKDVIIKRKGFRVPFTAANLIKSNLTVQGDDRKEALERGRETAAAYIKTPLFERVMDTITEVEREYFGYFGGVPLLGQLDAIVDGCVFDWKLRGFKSKKLPSLTKGFCKKYNWSGREFPFHKARFPLSEMNEGWAIQMCIYNWLAETEHNKYIIHEINPEWMCELKGTIGPQIPRATMQPFQSKLMENLDKMWEAIHGQLRFSEIEEAFPTMRKCHAYNVMCSAAGNCSAYKRIILNSERRKYVS